MHITDRDRRLFYQAAAKARGVDAKVRVGALLSKGRTTLAVCGNWVTPSVPTPRYHAERQVLRDHETQFKCTLYVARLGMDGDLRASLPCYDCMMHIQSGPTICKVVYFDGAKLKKVRV